MITDEKVFNAVIIDLLDSFIDFRLKSKKKIKLVKMKALLTEFYQSIQGFDFFSVCYKHFSLDVIYMWEETKEFLL